MLKELYNTLRWAWNATWHEQNRNNITIKCGNGSRVYGEYNLEIIIDPGKDMRDARVSCTRGLDGKECPNTWCEYFYDNVDTKLSIEEIIWLNKMNGNGTRIDPKNRPYYIEKI